MAYVTCRVASTSDAVVKVVAVAMATATDATVSVNAAVLSTRAWPPAQSVCGVAPGADSWLSLAEVLLSHHASFAEVLLSHHASF